MGTDIHGIWQKKNKETNQWEDIESLYDQERHYQLFAVLAGVRNGVGFAGVTTGERVEPISDPKGLPDDFINEEYYSEEDEDYYEGHPVKIKHLPPRRQKWFNTEEMHIFMGDHSFSWLSGEEMLEWYNNAPEVLKTGCITKEVYDKWDGVTAPESWCGDAWGNDVVFKQDGVENWTYARVIWREKLSDSLSYFFDEVKRLVGLHGEIRFVFGFDS